MKFENFKAPKEEDKQKKDIPQREKLMPTLLRETHIGPVDKFLIKRAEWMIDELKLQSYLAPKIKFASESDWLAGKVEQGVQVLFVGAGKGHEMDEADMLLPGSTMIGVDPHDYQSRPVQNRLETLAHDAHYLPETESAEHLSSIEDKSMDGITFNFVLHHIDPSKYETVMGEMQRVLKDDGYIFIAEDLVDSEEEKKLVEKVDRRINLELDAGVNPEVEAFATLQGK